MPQSPPAGIHLCIAERYSLIPMTNPDRNLRKEKRCPQDRCNSLGGGTRYRHKVFVLNNLLEVPSFRNRKVPCKFSEPATRLTGIQQETVSHWQLKDEVVVPAEVGLFPSRSKRSAPAAEAEFDFKVGMHCIDRGQYVSGGDKNALQFVVNDGRSAR